MDALTSLLQQKNMLHTLLVEINGKIEGAELAAKYRDKYYVLNGGYKHNTKQQHKPHYFTQQYKHYHLITSITHNTQ